VTDLEAAVKAKDTAYAERNRCVAALARVAVVMGLAAWRARHVGDLWEDDWRNIVFIRLPEGQVSWHIHDSELPLFDWLPLRDDRPWDGHDTPEKYRRLDAWEAWIASALKGGK
jgi:hypothetical protein